MKIAHQIIVIASILVEMRQYIFHSYSPLISSRLCRQILFNNNSIIIIPSSSTQKNWIDFDIWLNTCFPQGIGVAPSSSEPEKSTENPLCASAPLRSCIFKRFTRRMDTCNASSHQSYSAPRILNETMWVIAITKGNFSRNGSGPRERGKRSTKTSLSAIKCVR